MKVLKDYTLVFAMVLGLALFLSFRYVPLFSEYKEGADAITSAIMPSFIFVMLFLSFTTVSPKDLKPKKWFLWHLLFQLGVSSALLFILLPFDVKIASALYVSFICPTAVASTVITDKLRGNVASLVSYIIVVNCVVSFAIPLILPMIPGEEKIPFLPMVWTIMKKIFPLLVLPVLSAWCLRWLWPWLHNFFYKIRWVSFYIWALSLVLLIADILDSLFADGYISIVEVLIMLCSCMACLLQFFLGKRFAASDGPDSISARQALGQKNTIFAIWLCVTFLDPVVAVAPGSYILWQNIVNSIELRRSRK